MQRAIKPIIRYPGSKGRMAAYIIDHFPNHTHYIELYFGSGIVMLNKARVAHEVINDLDDNVVNLFRVIRDAGDQLAALVEMTPYARSEYALCKAERVDDPIEQARRFVVQCWQGHGSSAGGRGSGWKNGGVHGDKQLCAQTWCAIPERIRAVIERMRGVEIENRPALEVIARFGTADTLIYADPPYPKSVRSGRLYSEDDMTDTDHIALLDTLNAYRGPVVLSGYACDLYQQRLPHWARRTFDTTDAKGQYKQEIVWLNQTCIDRLGYGPLFNQDLL